MKGGINMYIFKNAFVSIVRNKGRNILIGLIILVVSLACTINLAINNTANDLIKSYESSYDKEVTISFDRDSMMKDFDFSDSSKRDEAKDKFSNISSYSVDDVKSFAESSHIKGYHYTYNVSLNGSNVEKVTSEKDDKMGGFPGGFERLGESSLDFSFTGYSSLDSMSEFMEGTYEVTKITDDAWDKAFEGNYIFINEELASYNNISLNDKIKFCDEVGNEYEFEVIGIYKENDDSSTGMFSNSANTIITNADCLSGISGKVDATFIIDDYDNVDKVQKEFYSKGLDENYVLRTNEESVKSSVSSIQNVKNFASVFLVITLIIGGVVLFIINMINIRERKYEIGVFRTIGMSKFKLTCQFVLELLIISTIALIIGAGIGSCMSKSVSNEILKSEIQSSKESLSEMRENFGGPKGGPEMNFRKGRVSVQAYDSIDAVVDFKVVLELVFVCLVLVLISSIAAMISIQRFSPLTILKERS